MIRAWKDWDRPYPPERFHAFISYTTRETEMKKAKPIVDYFLENHLRPVGATSRLH